MDYNFIENRNFRIEESQVLPPIGTGLYKGLIVLNGSKLWIWDGNAWQTWENLDFVLRDQLHYKLFENSEYVINTHRQGSTSNGFYLTMPPALNRTYSVDNDDYYYEISTFGQWDRRGANQSDGIDKTTLYIHFLKSANGTDWTAFDSKQFDYVIGNDYIILTKSAYLTSNSTFGSTYIYVDCVVQQSATYNPNETPVYPTANYSGFFLDFKVRRVLKASWKKRLSYGCLTTYAAQLPVPIPGNHQFLPFAGYYHLDFYCEVSNQACSGTTPPGTLYPYCNQAVVRNSDSSDSFHFLPENPPSSVIQGSCIIYNPSETSGAFILNLYFPNDQQLHNLTYGIVHLHYLNNQAEGLIK